MECYNGNCGSTSNSSGLLDALRSVESLPEDEIFKVNRLYAEDPDQSKVNAGIGSYYDDQGRPYVFPTVREVQEMLVTKRLSNEYLPIDGLKELKPLCQELIFSSQGKAYKEKRIASIQTLSGTGALSMAARFLRRNLPVSCVYVSDPTWSNYKTLFREAGYELRFYPYWDQNKREISFQDMLEVLSQAPSYSLIVFQTSGHNPTGMDLTDHQWQQILNIVTTNKLVPLFDTAYQGCCSGDVDADVYAIRLFDAAGIHLLVAQSFSKNMGLYGQRIGMLHITCESTSAAAVVLSHLKVAARTTYSNPPCFGAYVVREILSSPTLRAQWIKELREEFVTRIRSVRQELCNRLREKKTPGEWKHILQQQGMFSFTGLTPLQCHRMLEKWRVYIIPSGRMSLAGINSTNIEYVVNAIDDCVRNV